jgi:hypothetical protein
MSIFICDSCERSRISTEILQMKCMSLETDVCGLRKIKRVCEVSCKKHHLLYKCIVARLSFSNQLAVIFLKFVPDLYVLLTTLIKIGNA